MNWLDIIIIICVLIGIIKGLLDGFIKQVVSLLALACGILFAGLLAKPIKSLLLLLPEDSLNISIVNGISYVLAFVVIMIIITLLGKAIELVINLTPVAILNKLAGAIIGACLWVLALSFLINLVEVFDVNSMLLSKETKSDSTFYYQIKSIVPTIYPIARDFFIK
jgi:Uncharacterized membrane protein, required for colicin V production